MKTKKASVFVLMAISLLLVQCNKDKDNPEDPQPIANEPEQITKVNLTFVNDSTSDSTTYSWSDNDGEGGNAPEIDTLFLKSSSSYSVQIAFIDASGTEENDLTIEVREESDEHLVCYDLNVDLQADMSVDIADSDGSLPIGLSSTWETIAAKISTIEISLKHQPDGLKDGTCGPGDTDVQVVFPVVIID